MRVGIIAVGRDCADVMDGVLAPWLSLMDQRPNQFHLCLIASTFREMGELGLMATPDSATSAKMNALSWVRPKDISTIIFDHYATESEVRERGRQILMAKDVQVDLIWLLDLSDEYYTVAQITEALSFMETNPFIAWARLPFRNYVFDRRTYLMELFTPPRIWRARVGKMRLDACRYDNDFTYTDGQRFIMDMDLAHVTISLSTPIRHDSWLNTPRSQLKVRYQSLHFAHGAGCSFIWDDSRGGLLFNESYYKALGQPLPTLGVDVARQP